jgi:myo-inositol 2-dehydrogenase/D-chiro-inositol 1-dehydrogenase
MIRLGIIGCGRVAEERHLRSLLRLPQIRVVATADLDPGRSSRLADRFGAAHRLSDYRALLDLTDVDAVAVLTPTQSHAEVGMAALDAGKHVLVEKPLALNLPECDQLIAHAARSNRRVVVGFNLRWHRLVRRARAFLDTGALGRIKAIRSVYTHNRLGDKAPEWHRKLELGGGVSFNEGVHHFDLWRYFTGSGVEQVFSFSIPSPHYEDETSAVTARMANGTLATGIFTFRTGPNSEVEIYGFDGLDFFPNSKYPGNIGDRLMKTAAALGGLPETIPILLRGGDFQVTFDGLWRHFIDCISHSQPSQCTLEDGRSSLRVALAAIESARSGLPVQIQAHDS